MRCEIGRIDRNDTGVCEIAREDQIDLAAEARSKPASRGIMRMRRIQCEREELNAINIMS